MVKAIYGKTWDKLMVKMIGYYHDHCYHLYTGECDKLPEQFNKFHNKKSKFVFIYEESKPNKY